MKTREIPEEIRYDFAVMVDQIIYEMLVTDEEMNSVLAIKILAMRYNVKEDDLIQCLFNNDSPFTRSSSIIYYDGETFVKRTTLLARVMKIYYKVIRDMIRYDHPRLSTVKIDELIQHHRRTSVKLKDVLDLPSFSESSDIIYHVMEECYG